MSVAWDEYPTHQVDPVLFDEIMVGVRSAPGIRVLSRIPVLLDAGCRDGRMAFAVADAFPGVRVLAVDEAPLRIVDAVAAAWVARDRRVEFMLTRGWQLPEETGPVDAAWSAYPADARYLPAVAAVLRPWGVYRFRTAEAPLNETWGRVEAVGLSVDNVDPVTGWWTCVRTSRAEVTPGKGDDEHS